MNIFESITSAVKNVFANKTRALLTMLGIIIGIGSVIVITSLGQGSQAQITSQFSEMGVGRLTVMIQRSRNISRNDALSLDDYELLKDYDALKYISAVSSNSASVKLENPKESKTADITGVNGDYSAIMSPTVLFGRYINENDVDMGSKVVVIQDTTATKVFGYVNASVVGQKISIKTSNGSQKYTVIGVIENTNAALQAMYDDQFPESMVMPITTTQRLFGSKQISNIFVVVNDTDKIDAVAEEITAKLDQFHGTTEKYYVQNSMNMMEQINEVMGTVTTLISSVAAISLLVGGIGVMNIMLVTVTERTREIGIRKSIGAKRRDIMFQFLIEAVILTGIGGVLGLLLGYGGGIIAGKFLNITPVLSVTSICIAVGISTAIGIVFGVYPANRAAKLDPIEALRYE